jgi:L-threonylcarbamoyladenylate synthase
VSPTTAQDVVDDLGELLDVERDRVLDGGACQVGIESTIVDATTDQPRILRPGAVTEQQISDWTGLGVRSADGTIRVPGSLEAHYSPRATVLLAERAGLSGLLRSLASADPPRVVGLIAPSDVPTTTKGHVLELAAPRDSLEYAHDLYSALRRADDQGVEIVVAVLPHHDGIGRAVRDRLTRAANKPEPA